MAENSLSSRPTEHGCRREDRSTPTKLLANLLRALNSITVHLYAITNDAKHFLIRKIPNAGVAEVEAIYLILNWPS